VWATRSVRTTSRTARDVRNASRVPASAACPCLMQGHARHALRGEGVRQVPGRVRRGKGARQTQGHACQRGEGTRGHPRSCSAAWHLLLLRRRKLLVAAEPTQSIFDDEQPKDITPLHTLGHTARHCAHAKVKGCLLQNVKGTFIGMSEWHRGIINGFETASSVPCDPRKNRRTIRAAANIHTESRRSKCAQESEDPGVQ